MHDISNVIADKPFLEKTKETASTIKEISMIIFEATARPDCVRGNSTWVGDLAPAGLGFVNYLRRMYDQFGIGTELLYIPVLTAYQGGTGFLIFKGVESILK